MNTRTIILSMALAILQQPLFAQTDSAFVADTAEITKTETPFETTEASIDTEEVQPETEETPDPGPPEKKRRCRTCRHHRDKDVLVVRETSDTVFILNKKNFHAFTRDWKNNFDRLRIKSIGLSGTSGYGISAVATQPIEDFIENHPGFRGKRFRDISRYGFEPYIMSGGSGVIGLGEGFRLGGGGMSGERRFFSDPFNDSILVLNTRVSYGGFLIEKATVKDRWNFTYGGTIGGGAIKVVLSEKNNSDLFSVDDDNSTGFYDEEDIFKDNGYRAGFFMLQPHCGFSYTFFTFFHIGGAASLPIFMSMEDGFPYTDDFVTANPVLQLKFIFGNLG